MARPGLFTHRKFFDLARRVGSRALAVGILEMIWHVAYETGDVRVGTAESVAYMVDWSGDPAELEEALCGSGFLSRDADGMLVVHDRMDHAPDYVRRRMRRERSRGARLSDDAGGGDPLSSDGQRSTNDGQVSSSDGQRSSNEPTPAPAPAPDNEDGVGTPSGGPGVERVQYGVWRDLWNERVASVTGLPSLAPVARWPASRKAAVRRRLKDLGEEGLRELLLAPLSSAFLRGDGGRDSWTGATFDWLLRPRNATKVLEGTYRDRGRDPGGGLDRTGRGDEYLALNGSDDPTGGF